MPPNRPISLCEQCKATGLPILPVRYAVVPKNINPALPAWASGDRVTSVALGDDFQYALRTLRTGYLYLFYAKNARGSKQWECYAVGEDGSLIRQADPQSAQPQSTPKLSCSRHGSVNTQVHYLVIEKPESCGATWIAYSEYKWSQETLKEYETNTKLRNKRMQTIQPPVMAAGAKHSHGQIADRATLETVLEYAPSMPAAPLPFGNKVGVLSDANGGYNSAKLEQMSTRYPWHLRTGMAEGTVEHMGKRGKRTDTPNKPHVLALWDAIGIAHELNGFRNDAAGWIKRYGDERELQLDAINTYDGLKPVTENRAQAQTEESYRRSVEYSELDQGERELEERLQRSPDDEDLQRELANMRSLNQLMKGSASWAADALGKKAAADAWPKYQNRIDSTALGNFKTKLDKFQKHAADIVDKRTTSLVHWLEAQLLLDTLNDFHSQSISDGLLFGDVVAEAMFGMGSCKVGAKKIEEWVKECKATVETNLLWRAVALNQNTAKAELDKALAEAEQHKNSQTLASALTWTGYTAKTLKAFADTYKKAQGVFDANLKTAQPGGSKTFGATINPVNMRGLDKHAINVGDKIFAHFRIDKLADYASEKIIQHIFSIRAFVNPLDSENLVAQQAVQDGVARKKRLQRLHATKGFMKADTPEIRTQQTEELKAAWAKFKASDEVKAPQAIKDARLALVVMLIEGVNFSKLLIECRTKNDMKSWVSLLASGMSITSALFDIASVPAKNLTTLGAESWGYQALKGWGGMLSGGASIIGGVLDVIDTRKNLDKGYNYLAGLYAVKAILGGASGVLTFAVTFTYAAPLVARLTGRVAVGAAVEAVGARAAAFIGLRIVGMALGGWITVGLIGIQIIIWWITPNVLQEWIDHSAFGKERGTGGYKTAKEQREKLLNALVEMGLQ